MGQIIPYEVVSVNNLGVDGSYHGLKGLHNTKLHDIWFWVGNLPKKGYLRLISPT